MVQTGARWSVRCTLVDADATRLVIGDVPLDFQRLAGKVPVFDDVVADVLLVFLDEVRFLFLL